MSPRTAAPWFSSCVSSQAWILHPSAPSLAFPEPPAHGPHATWALVPLGTHLGMVYSSVCLPWWSRAHEGGAWSLLNPQDQEQGLAHSRCSVYSAERTDGARQPGDDQPWPPHNPSTPPVSPQISQDFSGSGPLHVLGPLPRQLLTFRIELGCDLHGGCGGLCRALRGVTAAPLVTSALGGGPPRDPPPLPRAPHTARPVDAQDRFAVAAHLVLRDSPGRPGPPPGQRCTGPGVPRSHPRPGDPYPGCRSV